MKNWKYSLILLAPAILLMTSCGLSLDEIYENDAYNDPIFVNNYYREYSKGIKPKNDNELPFENGNVGDKVINYNSNDIITLNSSQLFVGFEEAMKVLDPLALPHTNDKGEQDPGYPYGDDMFSLYEYGIEGYGPHYRMNQVADEFKYGVISKLYDGNMFCGGHFQLARVQLDERGFGQILNKEMKTSDYFAFNFKGGTGASEEIWKRSNLGYVVDLEYYVNFYFDNGNDFTVKRVKIDLKDVPTSAGESYTFVAFRFSDIGVNPNSADQRLCGYSMDYRLNREQLLKDYDKDLYRTNEKGEQVLVREKLTPEIVDKLDFAVMLYEVMFPNSTWR